MVSECHTVPQKATITGLCGFSVPILADDVLHRVKLTPTMIGINYYVSSPHFLLLFSVHYVIF
jgi:hypothetical protein